jgi:3-(methylsulfanyl)propanoyl-CoA dehydrogenase
MSTYTAPLQDMRFVLRELAGLEDIGKLPGLEDATPDVINAVLEEAARFASDVLAPLNRTGDLAGTRVENGAVVTPEGFKQAYRQFADGGWPALPFSTDRGGQGLPELLAAAVNEIWQSANMAFALCPMLTEGAVTALETHGSDALKDKYLPKIISGDWPSTMQLTEPQAGSDLAAVKTKAERHGDHYLLSGQKIFITWGDHDFTDNIMHLVLARIPDGPPGIRGISLFLVPKFLVNDNGSLGERNDVYPVSVEHKLGIHGSPTCVMSFGDNGGAVGYLVGEEHQGINCMFTMMNHARLAVGIQGLSISERAYQQALAYAKERVQGRVPGMDGRATIINHPDVRRMLMLLKSGTEAMRALCYTTAAHIDFMHRSPDEAVREKHERRFALLTPICKAWCTELAQELCSLALQVHGGMGYVEETGIAQTFRDARITTIYEGTTGIQAMDLVGRKLIRDNGRAMKELVTDIARVAAELKQAKNADLLIIGETLSKSLSDLEQATDFILKNHEKDPNLPGAVAVNYLMLAGFVCGGWQMARAALAASTGKSDSGLAETKRHTARFYADHLLPRTLACAASVKAGSASVMAIGTEAC